MGLRTRSCGHLSHFCHTISAKSHITGYQHRRKGLYHPLTVQLRLYATIMPKAGYYAVKIGKSPGIYTTWLHCSFPFGFLGSLLLTFVIRDDCREQVDGYPCARYKKLRTLSEAEAWMQRAVPYPVKQKVKQADHSPGEPMTPIGSEPSGRAPASSSSSRVKRVAPGRSHLGSDSESRSAPGSSSAAGPSGMYTAAEDVVYTDGACSGNGQIGSVAGIGVWWGADDPRYVLSPKMTLSIYACLSDVATSPSAALADKPTTAPS
jgi:viroplasmin